MSVYPCTIVRDRYSGTYSGGEWTAWNLDPEDLPEGLGGSDPEEMHLFSDKSLIYGIGQTPDLACDDLVIKVRASIKKQLGYYD